MRSLDDEQILVVANLSRYVQYVELDLSAFAGVVPLELFGSTLFPRITKSPYLLTLGPHGFYWFSLCPRHAAELCGQTTRPAGEVPVLAAFANWEQLFGQAQLSTLRDVLRTYFDRQMLDTDDQRVVRDVRIRDVFRIRCHGDCHLGQLLDTGKSFVFVDFEGDPTRSIDERRVKRSPLRDVVGMLRSFEYATQAVVLGLGTGRGHPQGVIRPNDRTAATPWATFFRQCVCRRFLQAYLDNPRVRELLPSDLHDLKRLLDLFTLERLVHETMHELRYRRDWLRIPLLGLTELARCETESAPLPSSRSFGQ